MTGRKENVPIEDSGERLSILEKESPIHLDQPGVRGVLLGVGGQNMELEIERKLPPGDGQGQPPRIGQAEILEGAHPSQIDSGQAKVRNPVQGELDIPKGGHLLERGAAPYPQEESHSEAQAKKEVSGRHEEELLSRERGKPDAAPATPDVVWKTGQLDKGKPNGGVVEGLARIADGQCPLQGVERNSRLAPS